MKHNIQWIMIALMAAGLLSACAQAPATPTKVDPATVEEIEGSEFKRVTVTEKAAQRLNIQTALVREEQAARNQTVVGEVVALRGAMSAKANQLWVRVPLNQTDIKLVARDLPAAVQPLDPDDEEDSDDEDENGWEVEPDEASGIDDDEEALYYLADTSKIRLTSGQRVFVNLPLTGTGTLQKVIPYAALIYDTEGNTYVYVKEPNALSFVRQNVTVDFIKGNLAYLTEGPAVNTEIVTVGVAELYGAETGVSK
ncbi:MAG TPA: hypothetical protein VGA03_10045 [Anaerolineales bacterium]